MRIAFDLARADLLVDDSPHHREAAERVGSAAAFVVVPAYGSPEDVADPIGWVRLVEAGVRELEARRSAEKTR